MIISVNGLRVGGMTETGLEVELETAGAVLTLLVSRYKFHEQTRQRILRAERAHCDEVDQMLNDPSRLDWVDIGVSREASSLRLTENFGDDSESFRRFDKPTESTSSSHVGERSNQGPGLRNISTNPKSGQSLALDQSQERRDGESCETKHLASGEVENRLLTPRHRHAEKSCSSEPDDGNAWAGCVCGRVHEKQVPVFWISCDECGTWYNVSSECVGFTELQAKSFDTWICYSHKDHESSMTEAVSKSAISIARTRTENLVETRKTERGPVDAAVGRPSKRRNTSSKAKDLSSGSKKSGRNVTGTARPISGLDVKSYKRKTISRVADKGLHTPEDVHLGRGEYIESVTKKEPTEVFNRGDLVYVEDHDWIGPNLNNGSGIAKVLESYIDEDSDRVYDIKYIVGRKKKGVPAEFVSRHDPQNPRL